MVKLRSTSTHFSVRNFGNYLRGPVIGINFGFTNSSVAILEERKAKVLKNDEDSFTTPSVVAFIGNGEYLVGAPAVRQAVLNSQNTIFVIKRLIGLKYDDKQVQDFMKTVPYKIVKSFNGDACIEIQSKLYSPSQIVSFILLKLKQTAENYLNKKIREAIITIPGYFNDSQKQALEEAGKLAGMKILRFVDDSATAAAIDCDYGRGSREIAVCNLNGGIFEFSILRVQDEAYEILSTNHNPLLSGDAFNNTIVNYFVSEFERENGIDLSKDPVAIQRLRKASEKAKCRLSSCTQTEIILPNIFFDTNGPPKHFRIKLTRSKFEELTENLIQKIEQLAQRTLNDAKMANQADDKDLQLNEEEEDLQSTGVTSVLTIGGMSKVPKIRNVIEEIFKKEISDSQLEDGEISTGAIYLGVLFGDINYLDDRRTSKNRIFTMASQKMFIGDRKAVGLQNLAKHFWRIITIMIKEYYIALHIDIRSKKATRTLGYFVTRFSDDRECWRAILDADNYAKHGPDYYYDTGDPEYLCNYVYNFLKNFLFIKKKKVWTKLKPFVYRINLPSPEKYEDLQKIKFRRVIKTQKNKRWLKLKNKKYFLFRAY